MDAVTKKVFRESEKLRALIPELKKTIEGRWVVFRDGAVQGDFATEEEAYKIAVEKYGARGGFVVDRVADVEPVPITAGILLGLV